MDYVKQNYKTEKHLVQRASLHEKYSTNKVGFGNWIVSNFQIKPQIKILELGCGNGSLWKQHLDLLTNSKLVLSDFSYGMIDATQKNIGNLHNITYKVIDIQDIPFEDRSFDVIIANSMLYYIPDIHKGLSEVRRVLKEDGIFYCSTYGEYGHTEYIASTLKVFGVTDIVNKAFTLQNGMNILQEHFSNIIRIDYEDSLAITNVDDLLEYIYSCVSMTNVTNIAYKDMKSLLQSKMVNGVLMIPKEYGMFVCKE